MNKNEEFPLHCRVRKHKDGDVKELRDMLALSGASQRIYSITWFANLKLASQQI